MSAFLNEAFLRQRLEAVQQAGAATQSTCTLFVVLRHWNEQTYVQGLMGFLQTLDAESRQQWLANFTKTRILSGDPRREAIRPLLQYGNQDVGFALVDSSIRHDPLGSLLVDFRSAMFLDEGKRANITLAGGVGSWHLHLDVRGLNLQAYIVHLTHLLVEGSMSLEGRMPASLHIAHLGVEPTPANAAYARIEVNESVLRCRGTVVLEQML